MAATVVRYLRSVGSPTSASAQREPESVDALPRPDLRAVGADERAPVSPAEFRAVLGNFASGVTVITAPPGEDEEGPAGFACQSFASLSLDPPLVTFMVARTSTTWPRIARAGVFCVNILGAEQGELCRSFAVSGADKFAGVSHTPAPVTGSPQLDAVPAWIDCRIQAVHTGGDHLIVVGRVVAMGAAGEGEPLLFHKGRFGRLAD
ncbi:flavin reductase family protein [Streptomyces sp. NPDC085639]|uniref:NADPH-flavin oxidoreductase n=3 Tax=Streptomyces TaxID=1883 RepID=A0A0L8MAL7_STRVG|nr:MULTISPECIES: flavin reductase family protein [Streptomyces]KOG47428.1 NADPH-flavin oxidoreductase [Streptomyces virginiae]KOU16256.1 NADPH-flavin oxidoreductase [Streptomyces sp. WM6368]GGZ15003.1 monooxygenase [Streptomyces avidinii]